MLNIAAPSPTSATTGRSRLGDLGADRGGQAVAEGRVAGRVEQPVGGRERPVVDGAVVGHLRAVAGDHGVVPAAPRAAPAGSRAHGPPSAAASASIAERRAGSTGTERRPLGPQRRRATAPQDDGRVADDGEVGGHVLVHLCRVEVDAYDGAAARACRAGRRRPTGRSRRARSRPRAAGPRRSSPGGRPAAGHRAPSEAGCVSSRTPLPLTVVSTGTPCSASARTSSAAPRAHRRRRPGPGAAASRQAAGDLLAVRDARRPTGSGRGSTGAARRSHSPSSTSTGTSRCTGRGRVDANPSKTSATISGISSADSTRMLRAVTASSAACWSLTSCSQPTSARTCPRGGPGRDREHRHRVGVRRGERGDRVGDARTRGRDDHAGPAGDPGVPVGGVPGALLVPGDDVPDPGARQVAVDLEVVRAGDAEDVPDSVRDQRVDDGGAAGDRSQPSVGLLPWAPSR